MVHAIEVHEAARRHRRTAHYHNRPIAELQLRLNADPAINNGQPIQTLTTALQAMLIPPTTWQALFRLLHDAMHIGTTAIRHQRNIRLHINKPHLVYPAVCVLPQCAAYGAPCSVQHELFDCPAVQPLWTYTHRLMAELDHDPVHITTLYHVWRFIVLNGTDATPQQGPIATTMLKINLVALTIKAVWDAYRTKLKQYQDGAPPDEVAARHRDECIHRYTVKVQRQENPSTRKLR